MASCSRQKGLAERLRLAGSENDRKNGAEGALERWGESDGGSLDSGDSLPGRYPCALAKITEN